MILGACRETSPSAQRVERPQPRAEAEGRRPGKKGTPSLRPERPRELARLVSSSTDRGAERLSSATSRRARTTGFATAALKRRGHSLATFQAAQGCRSLHPGHRPPASALGWGLPARWAGGEVFRQLRDIVFRSPTFSFLDRRMEEYGLSDRQSTDASDRAVDSRVVLVRTNDRLQHLWRRTC
jgi:hypothetical protein